MTNRMVINLSALLFSSVFTFTTHAEQKNMNHDSLWQITKALKSVWGKKVNAVSALLDQPLVPVTPTANDRFTSAPFTLSDGITISDLDVRLRANGDGTVALVSFSVSGQCITLEEVKDHFPDATLRFVPRAKLPGRTFGYLTTRDDNNLAWGFGFPALNRKCLSSITMTHYES
ncbi:hypothetical protein AAEY27_10045 [Kosakonia sp. BYX6]|uniref:Uncharacterized protein n=1 Tax=Kosakonia calanthes TaxID=3139408 RepID=A0ABZ3BA84_9ENTR